MGDFKAMRAADLPIPFPVYCFRTPEHAQNNGKGLASLLPSGILNSSH